MKLLKIRVRSDEKGNMSYPEGFLTFNCLEHIYCDELETGVCWLVVLVEDKNLEKITDLKDVEELTVLDAETFTDKHDPHNTEVTDEAMLRAIEIKANLAISLSATDLKALDPADSTPGIQYRVRFIDKVRIRMGIK
jgi:hypothetical protein